MTIHYTNELIFDLPDPLIDTTQHVFSLSKDGPSEFNVVISQCDVEKDENLQGFGDKLLKDMKNTLPKFQILSQGNMEIADQEAIWFIYTMVHEGRRFYQTNANFIFENETGTRKVIQVAATSMGKFTEDWKQKFEDFLASIKFRADQSNLKGGHS